VTAAGVITAASVTATAGVTVRAVTAGTTTPIMLGVTIAAARAAFDALAVLPAAFAALGRCRAGLRRVNQLLAARLPFPPSDQPSRPAARVAALEAVDVLRPAPQAPPVLVDADLSVVAGQRLAITGSSGSGKTTLLAALLRLLPAETG
jgi:ABC-type transport system involved in cytochrome bd biosynthesis fused ATPase/permease subunit